MLSGSPKIVMLLANPYEPDVRVYKEATALVDAGYAVRIVAWDRERSHPTRQEQDGIVIERCQLRASYGKGFRSLAQHVAFQFYLILRLMREHIDVIHCHDLDTLPAGFILSRLKKCRIVYDAHEPDYFTNLPDLFRKLFLKMEMFISEKVNGVFITNQFQKRKFSVLKANHAVVTEIRNCPTADFFSEKKAKKENHKRIVISYIGYIQKEVGIETAVEVFDRLCNSSPNIQLLLVGKVHPTFRDTFHRVIRHARHGHKIRFVDRVPYPRVKEYYEQSDISFLLYKNHPQYAHATPTKLFEAMAQGIPVVATPIGDVAEILDECQCGFLVNADDKDGILERFKVLIENANLRCQMGHSGYVCAKEKYCWNIMEKRLLTAYDQICRREL
jgi:glycosyltransferase involved in cell wall biosynthesis